MVTKRSWLTLVVATVAIATSIGPATARGDPGSLVTAAASSPTAPAASTLFVENAGQWPDAARFQVWGSPAGMGTTWLADNAIWITIIDAPHPSSRSLAIDSPLPSPSRRRAEVHGTNLKLSFPGSNPNVQIQPLNPLTTTVSYFLGNDPAQWRPDVPVYGAVRYVDLYPGVDLVLDGQDAFWRLEAKPGAETAPVRLQVEGAEILAIDGATVRLAAQGKPFEIALPKAPFAYQVNYISKQGEALGVDVHPSTDTPRRTAELNDKPGDLIYSTFLGGSSSEEGTALALDAAGRATVTGETYVQRLSHHPRHLRSQLQRLLSTPSWRGSTPPAAPSTTPPSSAGADGTSALPWR